MVDLKISGICLEGRFALVRMVRNGLKLYKDYHYIQCKPSGNMKLYTLNVLRKSMSPQ